MAGWSKTLAREVAPFGVTVNNILPGFTETDRLANLIAGRSQKSGVSEEEVAKGMMALVPAGRFAKPAEVAAAAAFLASPAAETVNSQVFIVYGPTVTLLSAPSVERRFSADGSAWDPADLSDTLREYFAGRDPKRSFSATGLMGS